MAETSFTDLLLLAKRGFWPVDQTMVLLGDGAWVAERLPATPLEVGNPDPNPNPDPDPDTDPNPNPNPSNPSSH